MAEYNPLPSEVDEDAVADQPQSLPAYVGTDNIGSAVRPTHRSFSLNELSDEVIEQYDITILHCDKDIIGAINLSEQIKRIQLSDGSSPKVRALGQNPHYGKSIFSDLEDIIESSTFLYLFLSKEFICDTWGEMLKNTALAASLEDKEKKWSVVPIHTQRKNATDRYRVPATLAHQFYLNIADGIPLRNIKVNLDKKLHLRKKREERERRRLYLLRIEQEKENELEELRNEMEIRKLKEYYESEKAKCVLGIQHDSQYPSLPDGHHSPNAQPASLTPSPVQEHQQLTPTNENFGVGECKSTDDIDEDKGEQRSSSVSIPDKFHPLRGPDSVDKFAIASLTSNSTGSIHVSDESKTSRYGDHVGQGAIASNIATESRAHGETQPSDHIKNDPKLVNHCNSNIATGDLDCPAGDGRENVVDVTGVPGIVVDDTTDGDTDVGLTDTCSELEHTALRRIGELLADDAEIAQDALFYFDLK